MFAASLSPSPILERALLAARLGMPMETVIKLRRGLDPNLSFEEHNDIFPLDLGPVWDLAAFQTVKRPEFELMKLSAPSKAKMPPLRSGRDFEKEHADRVIRAWPIQKQFSAIFQYALMQACWPYHISDFSAFDNSGPKEDGSQRGTAIHVDGGATFYAFKEHWRPPEAIILLARDAEPGTLFIKGYDRVPQDMIDYEATEKEAETPGGELCSIDNGDGNATAIPTKGLEFRTVAFLAKAEADGHLIRIPAGHVIAITNRSLHAGQKSLPGVPQNFARGICCLRAGRPLDRRL